VNGPAVASRLLDVVLGLLISAMSLARSRIAEPTAVPAGWSKIVVCNVLCRACRSAHIRRGSTTPAAASQEGARIGSNWPLIQALSTLPPALEPTACQVLGRSSRETILQTKVKKNDVLDL
jgi:hypothetical protein